MKESNKKMIFSTIQSFQKLCGDSFYKSDNNTPDLSIPKNRFTCMDLLDAAIRKKGGLYRNRAPKLVKNHIYMPESAKFIFYRP